MNIHCVIKIQKILRRKVKLSYEMEYGVGGCVTVTLVSVQIPASSMC